MFTLILSLLTVGGELILEDSSENNVILPDSLNTGETEVTYRFYMRLAQHVWMGQFLNILFPAEFSDIAMSGTSCTINEVSHPCEQVSGSTKRVRISVSEDLSYHSRLEVVVPGITNPTSTGPTSYFEVWTEAEHNERVIDSNYAFGELAFSTGVAAMTGSLLPGDSMANASSTWTFKFELATALKQHSHFRITAPMGFEFSDLPTCTAVSYDGVEPVVQGSFFCQFIRGKLLISGLSQDLAAAAKVAFEVSSIMNYAHEYTAGQAKFIVETTKPNTHIVVDKVEIDNPAIGPNLISNIVVAPHLYGNAFSTNNKLHVTLNFTTFSMVEVGGKIAVDFQVNVDNCFVLSGIEPETDYFSCATPTSTTVEVTGFKEIPAGATVGIAALITLGSSNVTDLSVTTHNSANDQIDHANDGIIELATMDAFTVSSIDLDGDAQTTGGVTINLTPNSDVVPGASIKIMMPSSFTIDDTYTVSALVTTDSSSETVSVSKTMNTLELELQTLTIRAATGGSIALSTDTGGIMYPKKASSITNPYEWIIEITHDPSTKELSSYQLTLAKGAFDATTTVSYLEKQDIWSFFTFTITTGGDLLDSHNPALEIHFPTSDGSDDAFPLDLGTGSTSTIPCSAMLVSSDTALSTLQCTISPASAASTTDPAIVKLSGFMDMMAGSAFTLKLFLKTSTTASSVDLSFLSYEMDNNGVMTEIQSGSITLSFSTAPSAWSSTAIGTLTPDTVYSLTELTIDLQSTVDANPTDELMVVLQGGFSFSSSTFAGTLGTSPLETVRYSEGSYASAVTFTLSGSQVVSTETRMLKLAGLTNGQYNGHGSGDVYVALIRGSSVIDYGSVGTLVGPTPAELNLEVTPRAPYKNTVDASIKFALVTQFVIPTGGQIEIVFPADFNIAYAQCLHSFEITGSTTCTTTGQTVYFRGFDEIPAMSSISIEVRTIINPGNLAVSGNFTVSTDFDTSGTTQIETATYDGFTFEEEQTKPKTVVYDVTCMPNNRERVGYFYMEFSFEASLPYPGGEIVIIFPDGYTLPTLDQQTFWFSEGYDTIDVTGQTLTIEPAMEIASGATLMIYIFEMTVPSVAGRISVSTYWMNLLLCQNSNLLEYQPGAGSEHSLQVTLSHYPTSVCLLSTMEISVHVRLAFEEDYMIYMEFPPEFPRYLGEVTAHGPCSRRGDQVLMVEVSVDKRYLILSGFSAFGQFSDMMFTLRGIKNPCTAGATSGPVVVSTMMPNMRMIRHSDQDALTITDKPSVLSIASITTTSPSVREITDYMFMIEPVSFSGNNEVWIEFPSAQYKWELTGYGAVHPCSSYQVSMTDGTQTGFSSVTCTNPAPNMIKAIFPSGALSSGHYLKIYVSMVRSASNPGETDPFRICIYDPSTMQLTDKSYSLLDSFDTVSLVKDKPEIIIDSASGMIEQSVGVVQEYFASTASIYQPAKSELNFTYTIESLVATPRIEISPSSIILSKSKLTTPIHIKTFNDTLEGNYIIRWVLGGESASMYLELTSTQLYVNPMKQYHVNFAPIPTLIPNTTSIPLMVWLDAAPATPMSVYLHTPTGITASMISFDAAVFSTTFTLSVAETYESGTYDVSISLSGENIGSFYSSTNSVTIPVMASDTEIPGLSMMEILLPKDRLGFDILMQTTESCTLYYNFGVRGLAMPAMDDLIASALNSTAGHYIEYLDGDFFHQFRIGGLRAEYDYVMYGVLVDQVGHALNEVFTVNLYTADIYDSVRFQVNFMAPIPSDTEVNDVVVPALAQQFVLDGTSRIEYQPGTSSVKSFILYNDPYSDLPSPKDLVSYLAIPSEINTLLSPHGLQLDENYHTQGYIWNIVNERPTWIERPFVTSYLKDELNITMTLSTTGQIFIEILQDGDPIPSSRQIVLGLNAMDQPADVWYNENVTAGTEILLSYGGFKSVTSYKFLITAINDDERNPRYMADEYMANFDVITQAEGVATIIVDFAVTISALLSIILIF